MKIGIDIRPLLLRPTGVGVWLLSLLESINGKSNHSFVYFSSSLKGKPFELKRKLPAGKFIHRRFPGKLLDFLLLNFLWPSFEALTGDEVDVTLSPTPIYFPTKGKKIVTVHDLYFYERKEKAGKFAVYTRKLKRSMNEADFIIAVSKYTKDKVLSYFPEVEEKVKVLYEGIREFPESERVEGLPEEFLLFTGGCIHRKNLPLAVEISRLSKIPLVVVGECGKYPEGIIGFPYISDGKLKFLYENAFALIFPSFDEGFGLPVVEAMNFGLPVLSLPTGAISEIAGDAVIFCERPYEFVKSLEKLKDKGLREKVIKKAKDRAKLFSWGKAGEEFLSSLEKL